MTFIHRLSVSCVVVFAALLFSENATAQKSQNEFTPKGGAIEMPDASCFPNPLAAGSSLSLSVEASESVLEHSVFSVKIMDENGNSLFAAELPDELEFTPPSDRFRAGLYYVQFFQNGNLFETQELLIK